MITENTRMSDLDFQDLKLKQVKENLNGKSSDIIRFEGKVTNGNSFELNRKIYQIFNNNNYNLILDLSNLRYINSSGIAMLFSIMYRARENGGKVVIGGMHPFLHTVFGLMDLPPRLEIYDTLDEAKSVF